MLAKGVPNLSKPTRDLSNGLFHTPLVKDVVNSVTATVQAPIELTLQTVLGAISTAAQGLIDVERIYGGSGPTSLFLCVIAESGERKTGVATKVFKPIIDFEIQEAKKYAEKREVYELELEIFDDKKKLIKKKLSQAMKTGKKEAIESAEAELLALQRKKPKEPIKSQFIFEDGTPESVQFEMSKGKGSVAIVSNEGGTVFGGPIARGLPFLASQWSGEPFTVNRKTSESFTLANTRLTCSILIQSSAFETFLQKKGVEALGIGLLGRFLFCNPLTTQGTRFLDQSRVDSKEGYERYVERMEEILAENATTNQTRHVIRFSDEAKTYAYDLYNEIELGLQVNGRFQYAKDHGNKLLENIGRIAALLSYFEHGKDEKISLGILQDAERIAFHFSDTYLRCFQTYPNYLKNAFALQEYCQTKRENGERYIAKSAVRRSGPSRLRSQPALSQALDILQSWNEVMVYKFPTTGLVYIDLYPAMAHQPHMWELFCHNFKRSK